jgi:DNA-binding NtrC family response regulator
MKKSDLKILVVDDELIVRESLTKWFREDGFRVENAGDAQAALKKLREGSWNLMLADIRMPGMDGLELMQRAKALHPGIVVIIITAYATVDNAVRALKQGAYDYVTKPIDPDYLNHIVINALEQLLLMQENRLLRNAVSELTAGNDIVGDSPEMRRVIELIAVVAPTDTNVLVKGEVGTGKELVARTIHQRSTRRFLPLVMVNCGAVTETKLLEELFGNQAAGAVGVPASQQGKIWQADGGTLFLDEVGCLDAAAQGELLRVLEARQQVRAGGGEIPPANFRLICATKDDLENAVREKRFRDDLFFRLTVFDIDLPPLRARRGDVAKLAHFFLEKYARAMSRKTQGFSPEAMLAMKAYDWPGNVRELENVIERALVVAPGPVIGIEYLIFHTSLASPTAGQRLEDIERRHIEQVLRETGWNVSRSAAILDIDRVTLYHKIEKFGLKRQG